MVLVGSSVEVFSCRDTKALTYKFYGAGTLQHPMLKLGLGKTRGKSGPLRGIPVTGLFGSQLRVLCYRVNLLTSRSGCRPCASSQETEEDQLRNKDG